jgi:hypothetical protein
MAADIEQQLAEAARAVREREVISQRCSDLRARQDGLQAELAGLQDRYAGERKDVERLAGISLARVLARWRARVTSGWPGNAARPTRRGTG